MAELINKIIEFKNEINNFYLFVSIYINDQLVSDKIKELFAGISEDTEPIKALDNLYGVMEVLLLVISEKEGSSSEISNTHVIRTTKIGEIYKKLDALSHELYSHNKSHITSQSEFEQRFRAKSEPEELYEVLGVKEELFESIDPMFLMPTENYVKEPPANAKIVVFAIKNTQNFIANVKNIVDTNYAKSVFPNVTAKSGVNEQMIRRYSITTVYPELKPGEPDIISKTDKVYQKLDEHTYRELTHYPDSDYVRNMKYNPINNYIVNFENKRILLAKQFDSEVSQEKLIDNSLPGDIKQKFIKEKRSMDDAIFWTLYKPEMTDDEVLKLGIASYIIESSMPKNTKLVEAKFDALINRQTLKRIF